MEKNVFITLIRFMSIFTPLKDSAEGWSADVIPAIELPQRAGNQDPAVAAVSIKIFR